MTRTMKVQGCEIPCIYKTIALSELAYYSENPRIYTELRRRVEDGAPQETDTSQEAIENLLQRREHVKELRKQIDNDGKVNEPLTTLPARPEDGLPAEKKYIVLEGNSRLAAVRMRLPGMLSQLKDVDCNVWNLSQYDEKERASIIFAYLSSLHIKGKKEWDAAEKASFIFRRTQVEGMTIARVADEMDESPSIVSRNVVAYELMDGDDKLTNWNYYYAYADQRKIKKLRNENEWLDKVVIRCIRAGEFKSAQIFRDNLSKIMEDKTARRIFQQNPTGEGFEEAIEEITTNGNSATLIRVVKAFRKKLQSPRRRKMMREILKDEDSRSAKALAFELKKIRTTTAQLLDMRDNQTPKRKK